MTRATARKKSPARKTARKKSATRKTSRKKSPARKASAPAPRTPLARRVARHAGTLAVGVSARMAAEKLGASWPTQVLVSAFATKTYRQVSALRRIYPTLRKHGVKESASITKALAHDLATILTRRFLTRHGRAAGIIPSIRYTLKEYGVAQKMSPSSTRDLIGDLARIHV